MSLLPNTPVAIDATLTPKRVVGSKAKKFAVNWPEQRIEDANVRAAADAGAGDDLSEIIAVHRPGGDGYPAAKRRIVSEKLCEQLPVRATERFDVRSTAGPRR